VRKGSQIYVDGQIFTRKCKDKDGVDKYDIDIRIDHMQMLGSCPARPFADDDDCGRSR
jgi:single-stranded DNA-binding protein